MSCDCKKIAEICKRLEQQEQTIYQLVKIIGETNKKVSELNDMYNLSSISDDQLMNISS